ncbi:MAG: dipeptidase [Acidobacteriaceae bacterium]
MKKIPVLFAMAVAGCVTLPAQNTAVRAAHDYTETHRPELLKGFEEFVAIPNVAADPQSLRRNAAYLMKQLAGLGVSAALLTAPGVASDVPPVVYGELKVLGAKRTVVFYAHYDGQPVTPSEWENGAPFTPVVKQVNGEPRLYGRGTGDDKAAIFAQLTALRALQAAHVTPAENVRFVWEGEEEAGSRHLEEILTAHRDLIGGDVWLVCDGPVDQTRRQQLVFGARGDTHVQITVFGPDHPLHSGHYGNWAPNPAMMLAQLVAGMKDENGRVTIPHFYDGIAPLGEREKTALQAAPVNDEMLRKEMKLGRTMGDAKLLALLNEPSLEVTGISSGQVAAKTTNSIPSRAIANIDLRLVVGTDGKTQQQRMVEHIRSKGYFVTKSEPTAEQLMEHPKVAWVETPESEEASRTPMDLPIAAAVIQAVEAARGKTILLPTSGGTVPLPAMQRASGSPAIMVPIANHDDNQHAANENLRLQNLWDGVETMASLMSLP